MRGENLKERRERRGRSNGGDGRAGGRGDKGKKAGDETNKIDKETDCHEGCKGEG